MLKSKLRKVSDKIRNSLVAHRGYHDVNDSLTRPLENTLDAYREAFKELIFAECDVTCSADGVIYLCHDRNFTRLSTRSDETKSDVDVVLLTSNDIDSIELTNKSHPSRLNSVLLLAKEMSGSETRKLVIEIKPSAPERMLLILLKQFEDNPSLLNHVGVFMSFNHRIVKKFREMYDASSKKHAAFVTSKPKFLILCRSKQIVSKMKPDMREKCLKTDLCDATIDYRNALDIARIVKEQNSKLDGFYLQLSKDMLDDDGLDSLRRLSSKYRIGVWGSATLGDPDSLRTATRLLSGGVRFVNTDLPEKFFSASL